MIRVTYGSIRQRFPAEALVTTNLYSSPVLASVMSADQNPLPSEASGFAVEDHALKVAATATALAKGAQTRNVTPDPAGSLYAFAPMKGRVERTTGAMEVDKVDIIPNTTTP